MKLDLLLQPGRIGGLEIPNRLVMAPIAMRAADPKGFLTPALADFYELRARGGAGLIIMGHTFCWPEEKTGGNTGLWSDDHIAPLADLASRVHAHGSKLGIQLGGRGTRRADGRSMAPTAMRFGFEDGVAREITVEEIEYWVENYGLAARRAREAGMDCVEIHAAHGKLVSLFLSPYSNRRTDEYGGSLEKRCRFPMDIVRSIRRHAGDDFPIIFRFSAEDMLEGGNTQEDGIAIAKVMTEAGVDAFEVSAGNQERGWNTSFSYFFPRACLRHLPGPIREATGKPVLALAKINDVFMGEKLLQDGIADFISMGRPFVADPWLLKKAVEGCTDEIRRCIYCLNCFTYGARLIAGPKMGPIRPKQFFTPMVIATALAYVLYLVGWQAPQVLVDFTGFLGSITSPGAMIILGVSLASVPLKSLFTEWRVYVLSALKLLILPVAVFFALKGVVTNELMLGITVIIMAMPVATNTTMLCAQYDGDSVTAAKGVFLSTLLSVGTIPLLMWLLF